MIPSTNNWNHEIDWFGFGGYAIPPPDAIVRYADGSFTPIMFHYLSEGCSAKHIARANGFDIMFVDMEQVLDEDDPLIKAYFEDGASDIVRKWTPPEIDGWRLVLKLDSENGPVAGYIRKHNEKAELSSTAIAEE